MSEQTKYKFPTEIIDLPSEGRLYPKDHPCSNGKIEIKYMTAKEEDILTSKNLIKKGVVIDRLLDSLIVTEGVKQDELFLGDKNAAMIAARVLAYGPEYTCAVVHPETAETSTHTFNLTDCPFQKIPEKITENEFEFELPISKTKLTFKILTGKEDKRIEEEIKSSAKVGLDVVPELTARLRHVITSVDGSREQSDINAISQNILARDSLALRQEISRVTPDIRLEQNVEIGGEVVTVDIPMTTEFFWPKASR